MPHREPYLANRRPHESVRLAKADARADEASADAAADADAVGRAGPGPDATAVARALGRAHDAPDLAPLERTDLITFVKPHVLADTRPLLLPRPDLRGQGLVGGDRPDEEYPRDVQWL